MRDNLYISKIFLPLLFFVLLMAENNSAQSITNYTFMPATGMYTPLADGIAPTREGASNDEGYYNNLPIGFTFYYMGTAYDSISASTNGWFTFNKVISAAVASNNLATGTNRPVIAPLWDDLDVTSGQFSYKTTGTAPNRVFTAQWSNVEWNFSASGAVISFQVKLYEATQVIEFVYNPEAVAVNSGSASVGINGPFSGSGGFLSVSSLDLAFAGVSSTTETTNLSTKPITGLTFKFTPLFSVSPAAPIDLVFTNVTASSITINFKDNSTNETFFEVQRSVDSINWSIVGTIQSTTTPTTDLVYTLVNDALSPGIKYYYKILAKNEASLPSFPLSGSVNTTTGTLSGTLSVGPTGAYASLTTALTAIQNLGLSGPLALELQAGYVSSVETFPLVFTKNLTTSITNTLTIRPALGATGLVITSNIDTVPNIIFDEAKFVIIDGRPGGAGSLIELKIENTQLNNNLAISFRNDASFNIIRYSHIAARGNSVIEFGNTNGVTGNDNNLIEFCNISDASGLFPVMGIYSLPATIGNSGNIIRNNNIYNFFHPARATYGINLSAGNTDWIIENNSFYQTNTRTHTSGNTHYGIYISGSVGGNHLIASNKIGGSAPDAQGAPWTILGTIANRFSGIMLNVSATNPSSVQGNIITNISLTSSSGATSTGGVFNGIYVANGSADIGTVTGNIIGSGTATGTITATISTTAGVSTGITITAGSNATVNFKNNTIGGITVLGSTTSIGHIFRAIENTTSGTINIENNIIGSLTTPNSIQNATVTAGTVVQEFSGLRNISSLPTINFINNTIANVKNFTTSTSASAVTRGIISSAGTINIINNTIRDLTTSSGGTGGSTTASIAGMIFTGGTNTIKGNTIYNLKNVTTGSAAVSVIGLALGSSTGCTVDGNLIHSLSTTTTGIGAIRGINISTGTNTISNNMIRLGIDGDGNDITSNFDFVGINESVGTNNFYFNSVYIGGNNIATGSQNTFAFLSSVTVNSRNIKNNALVNVRTNSTATGKHYAIAVGGTTPNPAGLSISNNIYYTSTGLLGRFNTVDYSNLPAWQIALGQDMGSGFGSPNFVNPTGTSSTLDLHTASPTPVEGSGIEIADVTTDFDGTLRSANTPSDIGADAGNFTAVDIFPPTIQYSALINTTSTSDRTFTIQINDLTGVPTTGTLVPRVYYKKGIDGTYFSKPGTLISGTGTSGVWSFTISSVDMGGLVPTDTINYYIIAQDILAPINIISNPVGALAADVNTITSHPAITNKYQIAFILSGVKTIGTTGDYPTLGAAFNAINTNFVGGNLTLEIISDTITETSSAILNKYLVEGSGNYTVTIKPAAGKTPLVTGSIAGALIKLNGVDSVTIDGSNNGTHSRDLTLINTSTSASAVIWVSSLGPNEGAQHNSIMNCNIAAGVTQSTATTSTYGIIASGTTLSITPGADNDFNYYSFNYIYKVRYGIVSYGESIDNPNWGTAILGNIIGPSEFGPEEIGKGGIVIANEKYAGVIANEVRFVGGPYSLTSSGTDRVGIALADDATWTPTAKSITLSSISRNKIHDIVDERTYSAVGISIANNDPSGKNDIVNNVIYNIKSNGTSTDYPVGIGYAAGTNDRIMYNTIYMTGDVDSSSGSSTPTLSGYGFVITSATGVVNPIIRNNSVHMNLSSSSAPTLKYAAVSIPTSFNIGTGTSDYNNLFVDTTNEVLFVGNVGGNGATYIKTLDGWKTGVSADSNSISAFPSYTSETNLYPDLSDPKAWHLNGFGYPGLITGDFNGQNRSDSVQTGPSDIGAFEFTPSPLTYPNDVIASAPPAHNTTTHYYFSGRKVLSITWPASGTLPASVAFKYMSGIVIQSQHGGVAANASWLFPGFETIIGGSTTYYYAPNILGEIVSENNIIVAIAGAGEWIPIRDTTAYTLNTLENYITVNGIGLVTAALTDKFNAIPVELSSFTAAAKDRDVLVSWQTATEVNTDKFVIQRKASDEEWSDVSSVKASGNTTEPVQYSFSDTKLNTGKYTYRLKMIDLDGTYSYSTEVEAEVGLPTVFALSQNYPNPFNPSTKIDYQLPAASKVMVELYNITGERVAQLVNQEQNPGYYTVVVNQLNEMASGVYIYRIIAVDKVTGKNFVNTKKMMLLK